MKGAVIYISSNREKPEFESKIIKDMLSKKGDLQLFSVTQKPVLVGVNRLNLEAGAFSFKCIPSFQKGFAYFFWEILLNRVPFSLIF